MIILLAALPPAVTSNASAALTEVSSVNLSYTQAEALAATLNGLFTPDEIKAAGAGRVLIIRAASSELLKQAGDMVGTLDARPAQFRLSVRSASHDRSGKSAGIGLSTRDLSTRQQATQYVSVLDGSTVALTAGQLRPVRRVWFDGRSFLVRSTGMIEDSATELVGTQLLMAPVLQGNGSEVRLNFASASRKSDLDGRARQQLNVDSTVLVQFGQWTSIASAGSTSSASSSGLLSHSTRSMNSYGDYEIMIELVPE